MLSNVRFSIDIYGRCFLLSALENFVLLNLRERYNLLYLCCNIINLTKLNKLYEIYRSTCSGRQGCKVVRLSMPMPWVPRRFPFLPEIRRDGSRRLYPPLRPEVQDAVREFGYTSEHILPHDSFLINLGSPDIDKLAVSQCIY